MHRRVLEEVLGFAQAQGYAVRGLARSAVTGPKGNVEFLGWLVHGEEQTHEIMDFIDGVVDLDN